MSYTYRQFYNDTLADATEVFDEVEKYGAVRSSDRGRGLRALTVYGGAPIHKQIDALRRGVHIVIGTPGRLLDLLRRGALSLDAVDSVVLDEADEMLRMGFIEDVEEILSQVSGEHRTALFSATMPPVIRRVAEKHLREPIHVKIDPQTRTVDKIDQRVLVTHHSEKVNVLCRLIESETTDAVLVFARTRASCAELVDTLRTRGFAGAALHGDLGQQQREEIVRQLRSRKIQLVVATDIAARGLDVEGITHVINFDPPTEPEVYVHRIGRTGRAGRTGVSILLATPREKRLQRSIEHFVGQRLTPMDVPTNAQLLAGRRARFRAQIPEVLSADIEGTENDASLENYRAEIASLVEEAGLDPAEIAAALAKLATKERPLRIDEPEPFVRRDFRRERDDRPYDRQDRFRDDFRSRGDDRRRPDGPPRSGGGGPDEAFSRLFIPSGHAHGVRPGDLVGAIANEADIPGKAIGAIDIRDKVTFIDIAKEHVDTVLARIQKVTLRGRSSRLTVARPGSWERGSAPPPHARRDDRGPGGPRRSFDRGPQGRRFDNGPRDDRGGRRDFREGDRRRFDDGPRGDRGGRRDFRDGDRRRFDDGPRGDRGGRRDFREGDRRPYDRERRPYDRERRPYRDRD